MVDDAFTNNYCVGCMSWLARENERLKKELAALKIKYWGLFVQVDNSSPVDNGGCLSTQNDENECNGQD